MLDQVFNLLDVDFLPMLPDGSVDAFIFDPPYGSTKIDWDKPLDWALVWREIHRAKKDLKTPIVIFSQQPFTSFLIQSNLGWFRYEIIWEKSMPVGHLDAQKRPMRCHENILVFGENMPNYYPVFEELTNPRPRTIHNKGRVDHYGSNERVTHEDDGTRYPRDVWHFAQRDSSFDKTTVLHPTQKPVALMERLIECYTQSGDLVVDPYCGSGSTGVAAKMCSRHYLLADAYNDRNGRPWAEIAQERLAQSFTIPMFYKEET